MTVPLSVCLLACNEEQAVERCLRAVAAIADEVVVVVDAKSADGSEKVAREHADRVEVRPYAGDIDQKRYCVSLASHEWVLVVDPDEVVPPELARELRETIEAAGPEVAGVEIDRLTRHLGRWIRHGDFHPDWTLRAFRRGRARWVGLDPHGRVEVDGRVERVGTPLEHHSYRDLADQIERIQHFSEASADAMDASGRRVRVWDLVARPPARFLRAYVLRRGFLDGVPGLVIAVATAFHVFLKYAKLWERQRGPSPAAEPARTSGDGRGSAR